MIYQTLVLERDSPIARLRLHRPERGNLIDGLAVQELDAACRELNDDDAVRAVVLTGEGDAFCGAWSWPWPATSVWRRKRRASPAPRPATVSSPGRAAPSGCPASWDVARPWR
jgi:hypothetical protein